MTFIILLFLFVTLVRPGLFLRSTLLVKKIKILFLLTNWLRFRELRKRWSRPFFLFSFLLKIVPVLAKGRVQLVRLQFGLGAQILGLGLPIVVRIPQLLLLAGHATFAKFLKIYKVVILLAVLNRQPRTDIRVLLDLRLLGYQNFVLEVYRRDLLLRGLYGLGVVGLRKLARLISGYGLLAAAVGVFAGNVVLGPQRAGVAISVLILSLISILILSLVDFRGTRHLILQEGVWLFLLRCCRIIRGPDKRLGLL